MMGTLDEMADSLDPQDAAQIREFRDYLRMRKENARLREINAELLAALEEWDRWAEGWCPQGNCCAESCQVIQDSAREVIAHAREAKP